MSVVKWSSPGEHTAGACGVLKQLPSKHLLITDLSNSLEELCYVVQASRFILKINSEWIKALLTLEVVHIYKPLNNVCLLKMFCWDWEMAPWEKEVLAAQT